MSRHTQPAKVPFAIFASGAGTNARALIDAYRGGHLACAVPALVVTNRQCPAILVAAEYGIPCVTIEQSNYSDKTDWEKAIVEECHHHGIQLIVLAGYLRVVGKPLLAAYPQRIINLHPSLLPAYPGLHSIQRIYSDAHSADTTLRDTAIAGAGVTVHWVDAELDSGPIVAQHALNVLDYPNLDTFEAAVHSVEHVLLPGVVRRVSCDIANSYSAIS